MLSILLSIFLFNFGIFKSQNWTKFPSDLQGEQGVSMGVGKWMKGLDLLLKVFLRYVKTILTQTIAT